MKVLLPVFDRVAFAVIEDEALDLITAAAVKVPIAVFLRTALADALPASVPFRTALPVRLEA